MNYKVVRTLAGKVRVKYVCPSCKEALESEITEAGQRDTCPACQSSFVVPGEIERRKLEEKLRNELAKRKEQEQHQAEEKRQRVARETEEKRVRAERLAAEQFQLQSIDEVEKNHQREAAKQHFVSQVTTAENTDYPALETYIFLMRIAGWICICGAAGLLVCSVILDIYFSFAPKNQGDDSLERWGPYFTFTLGAPPAIMSLPIAFGFFFGAQLIQLALDARRDIAKLVTQARTKS